MIPLLVPAMMYARVQHVHAKMDPIVMSRLLESQEWEQRSSELTTLP